MTCSTETTIATAFVEWRSLAASAATTDADVDALARRLQAIEDRALAAPASSPWDVWLLAIMLLSDGAVDPDDQMTAGRFLARAASETAFA